jgi:NAD(P)-dependent dehydrogenase (short-subunit alcohol dehydrogenase family)
MGMLDNKVAVITGSSRGLGFAIAQLYAQEGASVVLTARTASTVERAVDSLVKSGAKVTGITCDVGNLEQVRALRDHALATFGKIDIWVNNAGVSGVYGPTAHIPVDSFERVLQTNIYGTYYGSILALEYFIPRHIGKLINLLGRGSEMKPVKFQNAYAPTKAWVKSFTLALAEEYADTGVGVYAFNPGLVATDMMSEVEAIQGYEKRLSPLKTVMRMWGNPPEVPAQKALWLASPATDGKTGLEVNVLDRQRVFTGLVQEALRRLRRIKGDEQPLHITSVPPMIRDAS